MLTQNNLHGEQTRLLYVGYLDDIIHVGWYYAIPILNFIIDYLYNLRILFTSIST